MGRLFYDDKFVIDNGFQFEIDPAVVEREGKGLVGDAGADRYATAAIAAGSWIWRRNGPMAMNSCRGAPGARAGEIDELHNECCSPCW